MSTDVALSTSFSNGNNPSTRSVAAFLLKLYNMVSDVSTNDLIRWNATGDSFIVSRHEDFARELLPRYYKHNNFSSFVRQLNMYDFHKIPHIDENAQSKSESQIWEFANPNFLRDQTDLLCLVTRKRPGETGEKDNYDYQTIMGEIQAIKRHQMTISQDLKRIQADNQALWQEQIDTRARHAKHQETIDKILTFLGTVYSNQYNDDKSIRPKKRKLLLEQDSSDAIEDLNDERTKETFADMFKSASTSPILRPLRQPTTETASSKLSDATENRFTLPNFEARHQVASGPAHRQQLRNMNKMKTSPIPASSPTNQSVALTRAMPQWQNNHDTSTVTNTNDLGSADLQDIMNFMASDSDFAPIPQYPDGSHGMTEQELEQQVADNGLKIDELSNILDFENWDAILDGSSLPPTGFGTAQANYIAPDNLLVPIPTDDPVIEPLNSNTLANAAQDGIRQKPGPKIDLPSQSNGWKRNSVGSTPSPLQSISGSTPGSLGAEDVEEIDMDKVRGKKRKNGQA